MNTTSPRHVTESELLYQRARKLGLHGLTAAWSQMADAPWIELLIQGEETERHQRSQSRRIKRAKIGRFKSLADFDWNWPKEIDREQIEELFTFEFLETEHANVILVGPNGVGKTLLAQNLAYQAILRGHTVRMTTASELLADLSAQDSAASLERRLRQYTHPRLLIIDELGYLSYDARHADLLFQVVTRRYQEKSTIITTNRVFKQWDETFPNASCVVTLVDRLIHNSEVVKIEGDSYRLKEAKERAATKAKLRQSRRRPRPSKTKEAEDAGRV
jgi:DNA replication protein DnaC